MEKDRTKVTYKEMWLQSYAKKAKSKMYEFDTIKGKCIKNN